MPQSQTDICNIGLAALGEPPITAITDNTKAARTMKSIWDMVRRNELQAHVWNFSIARKNVPSLTLTSTQQAQIFPFTMSYQLPNDCLRLILVGNQTQTLGKLNYRSGYERLWQVEEGGILNTTIGAPLPLIYVQDVVNAGQFDPCFAMALGAKLGWTGCQAITGSLAMRKMCMDEYKRAIREALLTNALCQLPQGIKDDSWITSRL